MPCGLSCFRFRIGACSVVSGAAPVNMRRNALPGSSESWLHLGQKGQTCHECGVLLLSAPPDYTVETGDVHSSTWANFYQLLPCFVGYESMRLVATV